MNTAFTRWLRLLGGVGLLLLLTGCDFALFNSKGVAGKQIGDTVLLTASIMLIVVIPTMILAVWLPIRYRKRANNSSTYAPEWEHSSRIEFIVWAIPIAIIIVLATIAYKTSHSLDPRTPVPGTDKTPLTIQVVAMDWKWLFIYPEEQIATVNELAFPVNQPVEFLLTSYTTMNSFFIPKLSGQLYAMAGMENRLNVMATEEGVYRGMSSNYSGYGFSGMRFKTHVTSEAEYQQWVKKVKAAPQALDDASFARLTEKSRDNPVEYFSNANPLFFKNIIESFTGVQNGE
ncbi:MAG: ubiquinol oxidase subunit II [Gammaproteobacteria bacterium]|nr:MAG: ubiquinol oxidase subunit II [Gammaproteobacteria bacterium]